MDKIEFSNTCHEVQKQQNGIYFSYAHAHDTDSR